MLAQKAGGEGFDSSWCTQQNFQSPDFMAAICNPAHMGERKMLCHSFGKAVHLLLLVCMLVQEVAHMLFHLVAYVVCPTLKYNSNFFYLIQVLRLIKAKYSNAPF